VPPPEKGDDIAGVDNAPYILSYLILV